ncbi:MAG: hypothetical protein JY451_06725 [Erythrobacter sp.]|nr:MAG: hypothetical protein JY451_06725 [Erythrobacter sp.]
MLFALLLAAQFAADVLPVGQYEGSCIYPQAVVDRAEGTELLTCQRAEIARDSIAFGLAGWNVETRFSGTFDGDRLTVESVTLSNGRTLPVRGLCQVYYSGDEVSTIACTAINDFEGSVAANFVRAG